jgi:hypothetical protein
MYRLFNVEEPNPSQGRHQRDQGGTTFVFELPGASSPDVRADSLYHIIQQSEPLHSNARPAPAHSLSKRYKLARRLAVAVLFVPSVERVHKSIHPNNILPLSASDQEDDWRELSRSYPCGFTLARSLFRASEPRGGYGPTAEDFYIHPSRRTHGAQLTQAHNVYNLGVILLDIGLWNLVENRLGVASERIRLEHQRINMELDAEDDDEAAEKLKEIKAEIDAIGPNEKIDSFLWLRE